MNKKTWSTWQEGGGVMTLLGWVVVCGWCAWDGLIMEEKLQMNLGGSGGVWDALQAEEQMQSHENGKQQGVLGEGILTQRGWSGLPNVGEELGQEA